MYVPWIVALDSEVFPASCLCSYDSSHVDGGLHMFPKMSYALEGEVFMHPNAIAFVLTLT